MGTQFCREAIDETTGKQFSVTVEDGLWELYGAYIPRKIFIFPLPVWRAIAENRSGGVIQEYDHNIEWVETDGKFRIWKRRVDNVVPISAEVPTAVIEKLLSDLGN